MPLTKEKTSTIISGDKVMMHRVRGLTYCDDPDFRAPDNANMPFWCMGCGAFTRAHPKSPRYKKRYCEKCYQGVVVEEQRKVAESIDVSSGVLSLAQAKMVVLPYKLEGSDEGRVRHFMKAIESGKQLPKITLCKNREDGTIEIYDGVHRFVAMVRLNIGKIPFKWLDKKEEY
jgi:hypothetical protein